MLQEYLRDIRKKLLHVNIKATTAILFLIVYLYIHTEQASKHWWNIRKRGMSFAKPYLYLGPSCTCVLAVLAYLVVFDTENCPLSLMSNRFCLLDLPNEEGRYVSSRELATFNVLIQPNPGHTFSPGVFCGLNNWYQSYALQEDAESAVCRPRSPILPSWALFPGAAACAGFLRPHCLPRYSAETSADGIWFPGSTRASQVQMGTVMINLQGSLSPAYGAHSSNHLR